MAISEEIKNQICTYSSRKQNEELLTYIQGQIKNQAISIDDFLNYARTFKFVSSEDWVIPVDIIYQIGCLDEAKALSVEFYQLASERGSHAGASAYAVGLLNKTDASEEDKSLALEQLQRAASLVEKNSTLAVKFRYHFHLSFALCWKAQYVEASKAFHDYCKNVNIQGNENSVAETKKMFQCIANVIIKKFSKEECNKSIEAIDHLLNITKLNDYSDLQAKKQELTYYKAQCFELMGDYKQAMQAYSSIGSQPHSPTRDLPCYKDSLHARVRLVKLEVGRILAATNTAGSEPSLTTSSAASSSASSSSSRIAQEPAIALTVIKEPPRLPNGIFFPLSFADAWRKEAAWFDSVNEDLLEKNYTKRSEQIKTLLDANEIESTLLNEQLKVVKDNNEHKQLEEIKMQLEEKKAHLLVLAKKIEDTYDKTKSSSRRIYRQIQVDRRFFEPTRTHSHKREQLQKLVNAIIEQRFLSSIQSTPPIDLIGHRDHSDHSGHSARMLIMAEQLFQRAIQALSNDPRQGIGLPIMRRVPWSYGYGSNDYGPKESYQVGSTIIQAEHRNDPKSERLGDSYLPQLATYWQICEFLSKLAGADNSHQKTIANWFIRYGRTHQAVSLDEMQVIYQEASTQDIDEFNRICFLVMEKEQAQWQCASAQAFQCMAIAQARCLILLSQEFLTFTDVFNNNALFGIYSKENIINRSTDIDSACAYIEKMYLLYLQQRHVLDYAQFFKKHVKAEKPPTVVLNRKQIYKDLVAVYGSDEDTEEGYDSDLDTVGYMSV